MKDTETRSLNLMLEELKRRHVFRAAAIYAGIAWLLVQIATQVFPFFDVPNWAVRWIVIATLIGFPFVVLVSWYYEFTAEGIKRESDIVRSDHASVPHRRWFDRSSMGALIAVAVLLVGDIALHYTIPPTPKAQLSIAVMPFKSLSGGADDYLTDGIQDEILTRLAKISALRVISRTSTAYYAARPDDMRKLAEQLGITHIVEGRVQRHDKSARITVQLIDASTDSNLWAETYDRQLTDVFDVESDVAKAIADTLRAKLTGAERLDIVAVPTQNAEAYDAYLRGIAFDQRTLENNYLTNAAAWLNKAVEYDPDFAMAWARLARVDANRAFYGMDTAKHPCDKARQAAETASRLNPDLGEADLAWGYVLFMCDDNLEAAEKAFDRAHSRLPNNAEVWRAMSQIEWRKRNWSAVLEDLKQAQQLDPRNPELLNSYALYLGVTRQFAEARKQIAVALDVNPEDAAATALEASMDQAEGDLGAAQRQLDSLTPRPDAADVFDYQMLQLLYVGRPAEARGELVSALAADRSALGVGVADYYALLATAYLAEGNKEAARQVFRQAHEALRRFDNGSLTDQSSGGIFLRAMLCITDAGAAPSGLERSDCRTLHAIAASDSQFSLTALDALAQADVLAGRKDKALEALGPLLSHPYSSIRYAVPLTPALIRQDPLWAPLRTMPGLDAVLAIRPEPLKRSGDP